jgi:hypothetical protein
MSSIGGISMRIRIHCELCQKDYFLDSGEPWVGLMSCPHDACYHTLLEVSDEEGENDD